MLNPKLQRFPDVFSDFFIYFENFFPIRRFFRFWGLTGEMEEAQEPASRR